MPERIQRSRANPTASQELVMRAMAEEFARIQAIPQEEWKRRHAAKVTLGIAETNDAET